MLGEAESSYVKRKELLWLLVLTIACGVSRQSHRGALWDRFSSLNSLRQYVQRLSNNTQYLQSPRRATALPSSVTTSCAALQSGPSRNGKGVCASIYNLSQEYITIMSTISKWGLIRDQLEIADSTIRWWNATTSFTTLHWNVVVSVIARRSNKNIKPLLTIHIAIHP